MTASATASRIAFGQRSVARNRLLAGHPVLRVLLQRVALAVPLLFLVSLLTFLLVAMAPGDPARLIAGPNASPAVYEALRRKMGLDEPVLVQYGTWLVSALHGNFGVSLYSGVPVTTAILQRLPVTVSLVLLTMLVSCVVGIAIGVFSALRGGAWGRILDIAAILGFALPSFWIAAQLIRVFAVQLHWLPSTGYVPISVSVVGWMRSLVLPVLALGLGGIASIAKQTREAMLEALGSPHIRIARANGIRETSLVLRHALRNASLTVVTVSGVLFASMLGGTIFAEQVFALPGLGSLLVSSALSKDLTVVQAVALFFTIVIVAINIVVELLYAWLNPKIRSGS